MRRLQLIQSADRPIFRCDRQLHILPAIWAVYTELDKKPSCRYRIADRTASQQTI